jgi:flavin reductase (DIM6/NTAB) family NADH-FMN oxidoreductase RutF
MTLESREPLDEAAFRAAMGSFATGVTVICVTDAEGRPVGFTASSLTSVSLDPPLVLFCLGRGARASAAFTGAKSFAVSFLASGQREAAEALAIDPRAWFERGAWTSGRNGAPLVEGRLAGLECAIERVDPGGDHMIYLGRVQRAEWDAAADPLVYFRGRYRSLA